MTQDLKLTVYGLATDGSDGTNLYFFDSGEDRDEHIWGMITPDYEWNKDDTDQLEVDGVEYRARFDGDVWDAYDHYRPEHLTISANEYDIDLTTIPAVAALMERVKALEAFRANVASLMTAADCVVSDNELEREATDDEIIEYKTDLGADRLFDEYEAFESVILQARALALPDAAKEGGAA